MFFFLLLILPGVRTQDPAVTNYSPRPQQLPFNTVQFLQHKQARKGPILFPNDAPPPPPTPLIVTSRPLSESIARSELNPNNTLAAQSQYHQVTYRPSYLARGKNYEPYSYTLATVAPVYDYEAKIDYSDNERTVQERKDNFYKDYEKELMNYIHPNKQNFKGSGLASVEPIRRRYQPKSPIKRSAEHIKEDKFNIEVTPLYNRRSFSKNDSNYFEDEFDEEDNNFEFDFTKLHKIEPNSSEYLDYYSDSKKIQRRQFSALMNRNDFKLRPLENLQKDSNGDAWHRLSDHEKEPVNSAEEIEEIIGLPPRRNVMRNVKYRKKEERKDGGKNRLYSSKTGRKSQLRVVKPLYSNNVQRQQNPIPNSPAYKYKDSPDQFYHNKNNEDERDYNQDNSPADNYAFSYTVKDQKTGDDFSHSQKSTGSATNGEYRVRLPDGRMQIVSYTADENGYKADVRYDEQHNQDNSIDTENHKNGEFRNNIAPTYKYNDRLDHQDSFENEEYLQRPLKAIQTYKTPNNYEQAQFENINDYGNKQDNLQYYSVHPTKSAYTVTTAPIINDHTFDDLSDNNKDYLDQNIRRHENNDKLDTVKNDYKFSDEIIDYSSELDQTYQPHKSKFSAFADNQDTQAQSQVRPSYEELKDLFVTNVNGRRDAPIPVVSTVRPVYAVTTDNIVAITPRKPVNNLYTNIKNIASASPTPFLFSKPSPVTPKSYLLSTIANLKHQISLNSKPVLSDHYINKINKYLTYSNPSKISK
ncbi:hypothetical protein PYW08_010293 [Mythimna loreyi]|uniref:Uncharacterized protein n=1 Tax=Mythimna loreyi TaxID=667449 RepID=A0ACC2Q4D4_9NEOP|nr:hypothetical protein PYW08_010293 [Mythimna loreyi]